MIVKNFEIGDKLKENFHYYLLYGPNTGLLEDTINKTLIPKLSKNIFKYEEDEVIYNFDNFLTNINTKSFFEEDKLIIINRVSDKILEFIKEIIEKKITDVKIILKSNTLEKKSKLRSYFEKNKSLAIAAFYQDNYKSLLLMVQKIFKEKKIYVSNEILNLIIDRSKGNRINIINEIEKILSYIEKNNKISLEKALKLTNLAENHTISELVDQNLLKNKKKTINIINENNLNTEENILIVRTFLNKLKKLKKLKINLEKNNNIEQVLSSSKPPIFWKEKNIVKQQLNMWSLTKIKHLINKVNNLELTIKKNSQISDQILNNFILENLISANNAI
jgi:DNA polymerase-3 subunit delta